MSNDFLILVAALSYKNFLKAVFVLLFPLQMKKKENSNSLILNLAFFKTPIFKVISSAISLNKYF